jgi:L-rhamnose mutarotase
VNEVAGAPEHVGLYWTIRSGMAAEYDRVHATVWPQLEQRMRELGVARFSIFRRGEEVFAHLTVTDYPAFTTAYALDQVAQEWERQFDDLLIVEHPDPETGWPERLVHVWSM